MMRLTDLIVSQRALWYKIGAILFIALIITIVAFRIAKAMQHDLPPNAETFASEGTCKAKVSDEHGCYPDKGEEWCAAKGACINRNESDLMDDEAFSKHCSVQSTVDETSKDPVLADDPTDSKASDTCCMSGKADETQSPPPPQEPSCNACAKPQQECPKSECPKPVYCPPCPKCPPPCPRMCPDLSKYVLKTSIPPCPEAKVDKDIYMLKSQCKQPDMSKYVLKTSVPSFKSTPCPPCICKCDGVVQHQTTENIDVEIETDTPGTDAVPLEEALGGNRDQSEDAAAFEDSSSKAPIETDSRPSPSTSKSPSKPESKPVTSPLDTSADFGGNVLDNGGIAQSSAQANFEGTCHADSQTVNGYSIQPIIDK